jgi:PAS domain S-box-containing protein
MEGAITQTDELSAQVDRLARLRSKQKESSIGTRPLFTRPVGIPFFIMLLAVAGSGVWMLREGSSVNGWVGLGGSIAAVFGAMVGMWQLTKSMWTDQMNHRSAEWQNMEALLRTQMLEQTRREQQLLTDHARIKNEATVLSQANTDLNEELNRRKEAELKLSKQGQDLARSKGVLELHVQARTQEMEKMQRRHELILDSAGEGICGLNIGGKIAFVNPAAARILGQTVDQMIGRPFKDFVPNLPTGPALGGDRSSELTIARIDGSSFVVEYSRAPVKEGQRIVGEVYLFKDISERKQAEEALALKAAELARSNAELEQFAFVASHDLQEPLRKIQAFGDRLKLKAQAVQLGDGWQYLERMQNAAGRMRTLIDDLLTFSRVISRIEPFEDVNLNTVTREVLADLEVRIEKTGGAVEVGDLPTIEADPMHMRQLLQNLVGNALKFHEPGAKPLVKINGRITDQQGDLTKTAIMRRRAVNGDKAATELWCELTVQDNGIGFEEKYLDRIFVVFQRLHGRHEYEGTGIGLAVCRRIMDRHYGTITAQSKPGEGATFIVKLPAKQRYNVEAKK